MNRNGSLARVLAELTAPAVWSGALVAGSQSLLLLYLVWRYGVDAPLIDQWSLVEDLEKHRAGEWQIADLWRSHNGHRLLLPRLVLVPLAMITGWNTRYEMALIVLAAIVVYALLVGVARVGLGTEEGGRYGLALGALGLVVFSLAQWENWLWGFQLCMLLAVLLSLGSLLALGAPRPHWGTFALALLLAALATTSMASGLVVWPAGALLLLLRGRGAQAWNPRKAFVVWCAAAVAAGVAYRLPVPGDVPSPGASGFFVEHPWLLVRFVLTVVGAPVASFSGSAWPPDASVLAPIAGACAVVVTAVLAWPLLARRAGAHEASVVLPVAACALGLGVALLVAVGRVSHGMPAAMASRYVTLMTPFWAGHLLLVIARAWSAGGTGSWWARGWIAMLLAGFAVSSVSSVEVFPARHALLVPAREALAAGGPPELLARLHPELVQVVPNVDELRRLRLSVFRVVPKPADAAPAGRLTEFRQELRPLTTLPATMVPGEVLRLAIELRNPTDDRWHPQGHVTLPVNLAYQWLDAATGEVVVRDGHRTSLPATLGAGEAVALDAVVEAPAAAGDYVLRVSAVQEGVAWFVDRGAAAWESRVRVVEPR